MNSTNSRPSIPYTNNRQLWIREKHLLLNLQNRPSDIDEIYLYAKDLYELSINKKLARNIWRTPRPLLNTWTICLKGIEKYNPGKERKILLTFYSILIVTSNTKLYLIVTELVIRGRKLNISLVFITPSYFVVPIGVRLNTTQIFHHDHRKKTRASTICH